MSAFSIQVKGKMKAQLPGSVKCTGKVPCLCEAASTGVNAVLGTWPAGLISLQLHPGVKHQCWHLKPAELVECLKLFLSACCQGESQDRSVEHSMDFA